MQQNTMVFGKMPRGDHTDWYVTGDKFPVCGSQFLNQIFKLVIL